MGGFTAGLVVGCLLGVSGTFLLLSVGAAFSAERARVFRIQSVLGMILSAVALICVAAFCYRFAIGLNASMLLLLFAVLAISKIEGLLNGLIATVLASVILAVWFPPAGSLSIRSSSDRLALALFLLIATLGSRFLGDRNRSAS